MAKRFLWMLAAVSFVCGMALGKKNEAGGQDEYAYKRGIEALNQENVEEAMQWFRKEINEHPENGYAYGWLAYLHLGKEEPGLALSASDKALRFIPKKDNVWRAVAYNGRGQIFLQMGDTVQGLEMFAHALKANPEDTDVRELRAQLYYEMQKYDLSDADYKKLTQLNPGDVMGYMGLGRNADARGFVEEAIAMYDRVVKLAPDYSPGYSFRAESYLNEKKWDEASDDIVKALDIDGDDRAFRLLTHLPDEAKGLVKAKLKIQMMKQPVNRYWPYCLASFNVADKNYEEAIDLFEKANAIDAHPRFLTSISGCYKDLNDYGRALEYLDRAMEMMPDNYELIDNRGDLLEYLGRVDECIVERNKYVERFPGAAYSYIERAHTFMNLGEWQKALEDYEMMDVILPFLKNEPTFMIRKGDAMRFLGRGEDAEVIYNRLVEQGDSVKRSGGIPADEMAFALTALGRDEEAICVMREIVDNDTVDKKGSLYNLACVYSRLGRSEESISALRKAVREGYNFAGQIATDYDMMPLRDMAEFKEILKSLEVKGKKVEDASENPEYVEEIVEVPFSKEGGITKVKCEINGLPLHFIFDTGASEVTISMVEANFMLKNDYIKPEDIMGSSKYVDANGDISEGTVINLKNVDLGGLKLDNVRASVVRNQKAPLLLGQSVVGRLGKIEIDNPGMKLKITHKVKK